MKYYLIAIITLVIISCSPDKEEQAVITPVKADKVIHEQEEEDKVSYESTGLFVKPDTKELDTLYLTDYPFLPLYYYLNKNFKAITEKDSTVKSEGVFCSFKQKFDKGITYYLLRNCGYEGKSERLIIPMIPLHELKTFVEMMYPNENSYWGYSEFKKGVLEYGPRDVGCTVEVKIENDLYDINIYCGD